MTSSAQIDSPSESNLAELLSIYTKKDLSSAEVIAANLTRQFPRHYFSWQILAATYAQSGKLDQALIAIQTCKELVPHNAQVYCNLGSILFQLGRLSDAEISFRNAIFIDPKLSDAHANLGVALHALGRMNCAEDSLREAIRLNSSNVHAYRNLGLVLQASGRINEAAEVYLLAVCIEPDDAELLGNLGAVQHALGRLSDAKMAYQSAILKNPSCELFYNNLGNLLKELGDLTGAEQAYRSAINVLPSFADAYNNLSIVLCEQNKFFDAEASCKEAIRLNPAVATYHNNLGNVFRLLRRLDDACESYLNAISIAPNYHQALSNLSLALKELGKLSEAELRCRQAIKLAPNESNAHNNLGNILKELGRLNEAEICYREAIHLNADFVEAYSNLGNVSFELGCFAKAEAEYKKALEIDPNHAEANWNLAILFLLSSDLRNGLRLYEWRWYAVPHQKRNRRTFDRPMWLGGKPLSGRTIFIHAEQGLGDTIQFCRYILLLKRLSAQVIFEVQPALVPLLSQLSELARLVPQGGEPPYFDYHCPLLSLPLALDTSIDSIPSDFAYLHADPLRISHWQLRLGQNGYKIGICWRGSKSIKGRSIPLEYFSGFSRFHQVRLISLQKGDGEKDLENLSPHMRVETLGHDFDQDGAFLDTAAVIHCCDLVITNDTSIAHLSGALGARTWVALKFVPDWRWFLERSDSPWYPSMTLFRQKTHGDWKPVFDEMVSKLSLELARHN